MENNDERGMTNEEHDLDLRKKARLYNASKGYKNNCTHCKGRGDFDKVIYDKMTGRAQAGAYICPKCHGYPDPEVRERQDNVYDELRSKTFINFKTDTQDAREMERKARAFIAQREYPFFYIGGNVGTGKTHLCLAMMNELAKQNQFKILWWKNEISQMKAIKNTPEYHEKINKLRNTAVLFIDDLLKTTSGRQPTQADFETVGDIMEYRYNKKKTTLFTSEHTLAELNEMDSALATRIGEMTGKEFRITSKGKNQRGRR